MWRPVIGQSQDSAIGIDVTLRREVCYCVKYPSQNQCHVPGPSLKQEYLIFSLNQKY